MNGDNSVKMYICEKIFNDNLKQTKKEDKASIQFIVLTVAHALTAQEFLILWEFLEFLASLSTLLATRKTKRLYPKQNHDKLYILKAQETFL